MNPGNFGSGFGYHVGWHGGGADAATGIVIEDVGSLVLALDSDCTISNSAANKMEQITDRSINGPSTRYDANAAPGYVWYTAADVNWNGHDAWYRGDAGMWMQKATGTDVSFANGTIVTGIRVNTLGGRLTPIKFSGTGGLTLEVNTDGSIQVEDAVNAIAVRTATGVITTGVSYLIVCTIASGGAIKLYVNTTDVTNGVQTAGVGTCEFNTFIQAWTATGDFWQSCIYIYDEVLSATNINTLCNDLSTKFGLGQTWALS